MTDLNRLAEEFKALEDQLIVCMRCGLCQFACPLYAETGREADVARGKLALLSGLAEKMLEDPQGVRDRLDKCLLCGSCAANCPSGVKALDIFLKARAILAAYLGLSPLKKFIFRQVLAHPGLFDGLLALAPKFQWIFSQPVNNQLGSSCSRIQSPLGDRHFRRPAPRPFHSLVQRRKTSPGKSGLTVAFFTGCLIDKLYPSIAQAAVKILEHHQVGYIIPDNQACCGIPALSSGDSRAFDQMLAHNLELYDPKDFDYLITACATCTSTIKKFWPSMAGDQLIGARRRIEAVASKTLDISQFLVEADLLPQDVLKNADPVAATYHDPCHLAKSLGASSQPRKVIQASPGYVLREMNEPDQCCGMGGSFNLQHYKISEAIGRRKWADISRTGCKIATSSCPACLTQIIDAASKAGSDVKVRHVIELYAEGLEN